MFLIGIICAGIGSHQASIAFSALGVLSRFKVEKPIYKPVFKIDFLDLKCEVDKSNEEKLRHIPILAFKNKRFETILTQLYFQKFSNPTTDGYRKFREAIFALSNIAGLPELSSNKLFSSHTLSAHYVFPDQWGLDKKINKLVLDDPRINPQRSRNFDSGALLFNRMTGISVIAPEGLTLRTLIADQRIFEDVDMLVMPIGFKPGSRDDQSIRAGSLKGFKLARKMEETTLDFDYLARAAKASEETGKPIQLLFVGTKGITEREVQAYLNELIGDGKKLNGEIRSVIPDQLHSAPMGGVGGSFAYHYHTENFIFNARAGVDHMWGNLKQTTLRNLHTDNVPRLGWGFPLSVGVDYKLHQRTTFGIEGGVRISELKLPQRAHPTFTSSTWFTAPFAQFLCTMYPESMRYSVSLYAGYTFPKEFTVKTFGTQIPHGSKCKLDGVFGGLRFSYYIQKLPFLRR